MRDRSESAIRTGLFARLAVVAAVVYQLLLIGLILLRPEIDPARKPISEYAIGRLGWLAVLAFQISGAAYACLVVALRHMLRDRLGRIGMVVLCYCAVATVVVGLCVADPVTTPMTELSVVGGVHVIAGTSAFLLLPVAALMINISLSRTAGWAASRMQRLSRECVSDQAANVWSYAGVFEGIVGLSGGLRVGIGPIDRASLGLVGGLGD